MAENTRMQCQCVVRSSMRRALGYVRSSAGDPADVRPRLDVQSGAVESYARRQRIELLDVFADNGIRRGIPLAMRPAGAELLGAIDDRRAYAIVVPDLAAAFRSARDCLSFVEEWSRRGVALHVVDLFGSPVCSDSMDSLQFEILVRQLLAPPWAERVAA